VSDLNIFAYWDRDNRGPIAAMIDWRAAFPGFRVIGDSDADADVGASTHQERNRQDDGGGLERPDPTLGIDERDQRNGAEHQSRLEGVDFDPAPHVASVITSL
jgi:hypothetical protein